MLSGDSLLRVRRDGNRERVATIDIETVPLNSSKITGDQVGLLVLVNQRDVETSNAAALPLRVV